VRSRGRGRGVGEVLLVLVLALASQPREAARAMEWREVERVVRVCGGVSVGSLSLSRFAVVHLDP